MSEQLPIELTSRGTIAIAVLSGEVAIEFAPRLRGVLIDNALPGGWVVDLTEVTYLDTTALGVLAGTLERTEGKVVLVVPTTKATVRKLFEVTRLDEVFCIVGTVDEAVAALRASRGR
jgi:anti-sigma B factor antagonist